MQWGNGKFLIVSILQRKLQADNMQSSAMGVVSGRTLNATQVRNRSIRKHTVHAISVKIENFIEFCFFNIFTIFSQNMIVDTR